MAKSYYAILGITSQASLRDVKTAYRRLAKELHPDRYSGSTRPFLDVQEAYSVLSDTGRRREYDDRLWQARQAESVSWQGRGGIGKPEPLIPGERPTDRGDTSPVRSFQAVAPSLDEVFEWLWDNFATLGKPASQPVRNVTLEVPISREQARLGGQARVMVPACAVCPTCRGHGGFGPYECPKCAGEGAIAGEVPVSIAFPAGLHQDHSVVIPLDRYGFHGVELTIVLRPGEQDL